MQTLLQFARVVLVLALLVAAALLATPKGRVPLALRGVCRMLRRDLGREGVSEPETVRVGAGRRFAALLLVLVALLLALT